MANIYIKTYGCQMNVRDSEQVESMFLERGHCLVSDEGEADVFLLNTCSIREQAEQKALGKMGYLGKLSKKNPNLVYGFLGCMAQSKGSDLFNKMPHLNLAVGTQKYHRVVEYVERLLENKKKALDMCDKARMDNLEMLICDIGEENGSQNTIKDHLNQDSYRDQSPVGFVSIMQGCNMKCA